METNIKLTHERKEIIKKKVKFLYLLKNKTARDISIAVGISEKTIGRWLKIYGWKEGRNQPTVSSEKIWEFGSENGGFKLLNSESLKDFVKNKYPGCQQQINTIIDHFILHAKNLKGRK